MPTTCLPLPSPRPPPVFGPFPVPIPDPSPCPFPELLLPPPWPKAPVKLYLACSTGSDTSSSGVSLGVFDVLVVVLTGDSS